MARFDPVDQKSLALWAADCAERVLPLFEGPFPNDHRPRQAIEAGRSWARGEISVARARAAAVAAQDAARAADQDPARAAARAAGQAVSAHTAGDAARAAAYAVTAAALAAIPAEADTAAATEHDWQYRHLAERLRPAVFPQPHGLTASAGVAYRRR